jgi:hypothetical protein
MPGAISLSSSSHLPAIVGSVKMNPVTLLPGRAKFAMKPLPIGSATIAKTMGMVAGKLARQARSIIGDRLDVLVANAGVSKAATIEEMTVEDFDKLFAVNVRAPYFLVQQLLPVLGEGSSVILVSSLGAHAAVGTLSAYAATKGAIDTLVKYFAAALGPRGIRGRAGRDRHRHVEPRQDRRGQVLRSRHAGAQADWPAR